VEMGFGAQVPQQTSRGLEAASAHPSCTTLHICSSGSGKGEHGEPQYASKLLQKGNNPFLPGSLE